MEIPKGFKPKENLDERTEELLKGKQKKVNDKIVFSVVYEDLTLEEFERSKIIEDSITLARFSFRNNNCEYYWTFFPHYYDDCSSVMHFEQMKGNSLIAIVEVASELSSVYSASRGFVFPGCGGNRTVIMKPSLPKLSVADIAFGFEYIETHFNGAKILLVRYENVTDEDLDAARLPKHKEMSGKLMSEI